MSLRSRWAGMCFPSAKIYIHVQAFLPFLSRPPFKSHVFSRALWEPGPCGERWHALDMPYLFAYAKTKTDAFQVDRVQTWGVKRAETVCHFQPVPHLLLCTLCTSTRSRGPVATALTHMLFWFCLNLKRYHAADLSAMQIHRLPQLGTPTSCYGQAKKNITRFQKNVGNEMWREKSLFIRQVSFLSTFLETYLLNLAQQLEYFLSSLKKIVNKRPFQKTWKVIRWTSKAL